MGVSHGLEVGK
jgi:hypothetical protein